MTPPAFRVQTIAVLGAGTMGAQIAAHFANAGCSVVLYDLTRDAARHGLERARLLKPDPFFTPDLPRQIRTAGFDADLRQLASADWIIEAIIEDAAAKRALLAQVDAVRRPGSVVSSNTSGLSIAELSRGCSDDFRRHWLGTHFFNPPRYLELLEIIPTAETAPHVLDAVRDAAGRVLGKSVVLARDTPGFIANHVGLFALARVLDVLAAGELSIEEIDALTGEAIGRPRSATFRTIDVTGVDILAAVSADLATRLPHERAHRFTLPAFVDELVKRGWTGEKAGRGFYERRKSAGGPTEIWVLDHRAFTYRPRVLPDFPVLNKVRTLPVRERMRALFEEEGTVGRFFRTTLTPVFEYVAGIAPEIAESPSDIDAAMRWGYGWPLGPFELAEAAGVRRPKGRRRTMSGERVIATDAGCSLRDSGDGVLTAVIHSKMNTVSTAELAMLGRAIDEAEAHFQALVITAEGQHFSAGANLAVLLESARAGRWDQLTGAITSFQRLTSALRYASVPVVVAPFRLALGGGCEIALHADVVHAAAETYIGLVETRVGLIPAAGGTKEMLLRLGARAAFSLIGLAQTSTSAADALRLGYFRPVDSWSMHPARVVGTARGRALELAARGYIPPSRAAEITVGGDSERAVLDLQAHLAWRAGRISEHDLKIARAVSRVLSGGLRHAGLVSEDRLLELEREAFLSLCGEPRTLDRIAYTLETGKVLRN